MHEIHRKIKEQEQLAVIANTSIGTEPTIQVLFWEGASVKMKVREFYARFGYEENVYPIYHPYVDDWLAAAQQAINDALDEKSYQYVRVIDHAAVEARLIASLMRSGLLDEFA